MNLLCERARKSKKVLFQRNQITVKSELLYGKLISADQKKDSKYFISDELIDEQINLYLNYNIFYNGHQNTKQTLPYAKRLRII